MTKTLLLSLLAFALQTTCFAYDAEIDGIYYNLNSSDNTAEVTYYSSSNYFQDNENAYTGSVVIPLTVEYDNATYSVTSIGEDAFYSCSDLTQVTISESVTSIGSGAFYGCSNLTQMTISESVTSIGGSAFSGCSSLTEVTIPKFRHKHRTLCIQKLHKPYADDDSQLCDKH